MRKILPTALIVWTVAAAALYGNSATAVVGSPTWENSAAGKAFSVRRSENRDWLVRPDGKRFFSLGVCVVSMGASRESFDPDNPGYAAWQHYPNSNRWAEATAKRFKSWGFTTIGAWSDFRTFK